MSEAVVIPPGGGEVVGDSVDRRVEILCDHEALNATWSRFGPGRAGADLHVHRRHTDLFYVLAGELTVLLGPEGEPVVVASGTVVCVPPLVVHGFRNGSAAELRYLNFHAPGVGFADYMRAMRDGRKLTYDQEPPPADGGRPATEVVTGAELATDAISIAVVTGDAEPAAREALVAFYVLDGELELIADGRELRAEAGSWVHVPPGVATAVAAQDARYVEIHVQ